MRSWSRHLARRAERNNGATPRRGSQAHEENAHLREQIRQKEKEAAGRERYEMRYLHGSPVRQGDQRQLELRGDDN